MNCGHYIEDDRILPGETMESFLKERNQSIVWRTLEVPGTLSGGLQSQNDFVNYAKILFALFMCTAV